MLQWLIALYPSLDATALLIWTVLLSWVSCVAVAFVYEWLVMYFLT